MRYEGNGIYVLFVDFKTKKKTKNEKELNSLNRMEGYPCLKEWPLSISIFAVFTF